jgi:hypothetical protein
MFEIEHFVMLGIDSRDSSKFDIDMLRPLEKFLDLVDRFRS